MTEYTLLITIIGFLSTFSGIGFYFYKIIKNTVPKTPFGLYTMLPLGVVFTLCGVYLSFSNNMESIILISVLTVTAVFMSVFFLWILSMKSTPIGNIKVNVGDGIIPFESTTHSGNKFLSDELIGQRTLLKFYRGSWCPYCSREVAMFNEMKEDFNKFDVNIVGISGDTTEQVAYHLKRDNLDLMLLSDSDLKVVRQYGVEHHKALGADSENIMTVLGLPFPTPFQMKFKAMPIPTSILIDEKGVIKWIDQSDDYRLRASRERLLEAMKESF